MLYALESLNVIVMENTGLTTGRDKDLPFRVLAVGFGHLFVQLPFLCPLGCQGFGRLGKGSR